MRLQIANSLQNDPSTVMTYTDSNLGAGDGTIPVKNINSFTNQWAVQLGKTGEAEAEILTINGVPSGNSVIIAGTIRFDHAMDVPLYQIHYNKVIFKRSTAGTAGTATALSSGTVNITPNLSFTEFEDTSGATTYAYKTQYYNSINGDVSSESDWFVPGGPTFYSLQKIRTRVKNKLYAWDYIKDDAVIDEWINEWLEEMNNAAIKVNQGYLLGTTSVAFGTAGLGTVTDTDFMYAQKLETNYSGTAYIPSTYTPVNQFSDSDYFDANNPQHAWVGDTIFQVLPKGSGTARITYSKGEPVLDSDSDELPHPMRRYSRGFTYYALACAQELDDKDQQATNNYSKAQKVKADFINELVPKDRTGPQFISLVEGLTGSEYGLEDF